MVMGNMQNTQAMQGMQMMAGMLNMMVNGGMELYEYAIQQQEQQQAQLRQQRIQESIEQAKEQMATMEMDPWQGVFAGGTDSAAGVWAKAGSINISSSMNGLFMTA